jgi:hypothetical protein
VELSARGHRRMLSSFIEWAIEEAIQNVILEKTLKTLLGKLPFIPCKK